MLIDPPVVTNPFPGLRPFEPHEYHLFFGRDGQSDELLRRLRQNRFVAVVGTSGSGKSSLVRAGLLPSLHGGFMVSAGSGWRMTIFRPGGNPIGNLAEALNHQEVLGAAEHDPAIQRAIIEATLRRGALGLADAVRQAQLPAGENLLVVVDQFEEIFRFKNTLAAEHAADDAAAFVKLLLEATRQKHVQVYVIITMRSDFLGDCAQFRDLPEAINDGQYLIPRMTRDQRREAITGPVAVGGAEITPRLVNRLLNDVGDNPDQLPILQHALMRTWQQWALEGGRVGALDLPHYEAIGGMAEALSRHADKAYSELPDERSKTIAEKLFKLLTERGGDNREIRRPTRLREICAVAEASEGEVVAVIELFRREGRSFLMPPAGIELHADTLIDISHETLIRGWQRLKTWVDDEALSARIFRRLAETAALYRADEAGLWRDPDLAIALAWRERNRPNAAWGARYSPDFAAAMEFLEESQRARDAERNERDRQRRKTLRLTQALAAVLLIGFLLSAALATFAYRQSIEADKRKDEAEKSAFRAKKAEAEAKQRELEAQDARIAAQRSADLAERKAVEAKAARDEAQRSAAQAQAALHMAEEQRQIAERQRQRAEDSERVAVQNAEHANRLAIHGLYQNIQNNSSILGMADRLAQVSTTPRERAYWHLVKASARSDLKQSEDAIGELNEAIRLNNSDPRAFTSRSYQYLLTDNPEKAIEDARKAIEMNPSDMAAYTNLIIALGRLGRYEEAAQSLRKSIDSFTHRGIDSYSETEVAPMIKDATRQGTLLAESDEALTALNYERAILAAASGADFPDALKEADHRPPSLNGYLFALNWAWLHERFNPKDYGVLAAQGALWERARRPQEAARAYAKFLSEHEKIHAPRYDNLARWVRHHEAASPATAGDRRSDARALGIEATLAWLNGGNDALALYNKAVEADSENIDNWMKRAQFLYNTGDFDGARDQFHYILQHEERNAPAHLYHALAGLRSQAQVSPDEIRRDIQEARMLDPTVVPGSYELNEQGEEIAELLAEKNLDEALDFLERSAKYNPPAPEPYFFMAKLLNKAGKHEQALQKINLAIEIRGDQPEYYAERAQAKKGLHEAGRAKGDEFAKSPVVRGSARERDETAHAEALDYVEIGDSMLKFGNAHGALDAYWKSLKALDKLAQEEGVEGVRREAEMILSKIGKIAEGQSFSRAEHVEYLQAMYGDLKGIEGIVKEEIKRLSNPR